MEDSPGAIFASAILSCAILYVVIRYGVAHGIKDALKGHELPHHVADIRTVVVEVLRQSQPQRATEIEQDEPVNFDPDAPRFKQPPRT